MSDQRSQKAAMDAWQRESGITLPPSRSELIADNARLRAENAALREALEEIAGPIPHKYQHDPLETASSIMRRIARTALRAAGGE